MKYFFPDSQDVVDPSFCFLEETRDRMRIRLRDDLYAHEVFGDPPFDGYLVSKSIVDGKGNGLSGKYSMGQRNRLFCTGLRAFLRLDETPGRRRLATMGDPGAFAYVREDRPPCSVEEVVQFYDWCQVDLGLSVDHVIPAFEAGPEQMELGDGRDLDADFEEYRRRFRLTLDLAADFLRVHAAGGCRFTPVGVAQGWSAASYAQAVAELQAIGYRRIALGGLVHVRTPQILATLERVASVRRRDTQFHLLGVTRCEQVGRFARYGVTSFDSTAPLLQAFKDAKNNYHTPQGAYTAIRVPQLDGNRVMSGMVWAGQVDQDKARKQEAAALAALRAYDAGRATVDQVLEPVLEYGRLLNPKGRYEAPYRATLEARPWKECPCEVCRALGIEVVIFRGAERNRRRGFHNLTVLYQRLQRELRRGRGSTPAALPGRPSLAGAA